MKDLVFYKSDGTIPAHAVGVATLATGITYYAELDNINMAFRGLASMHWKWDASIIATITIEGTNIGDVSVFAAAASGWVPVSAVATVSIPGGSAGNDLGFWADIGCARLRAKVVVGGTGGGLRGIFHCKKV